jgi:hypothetical protein
MSHKNLNDFVLVVPFAHTFKKNSTKMHFAPTAYVSIRQAYVSIRQAYVVQLFEDFAFLYAPTAYVSIRQAYVRHTSASVSIRQHPSAYCFKAHCNYCSSKISQHTSRVHAHTAYVSIRQAYVNIIFEFKV